MYYLVTVHICVSPSTDKTAGNEMIDVCSREEHYTISGDIMLTIAVPLGPVASVALSLFSPAPAYKVTNPLGSH